MKGVDNSYYCIVTANERDHETKRERRLNKRQLLITSV